MSQEKTQGVSRPGNREERVRVTVPVSAHEWRSQPAHRETQERRGRGNDVDVTQDRDPVGEPVEWEGEDEREGKRCDAMRPPDLGIPQHRSCCALHGRQISARPA
jgi:hypothetical protein